MVTPGVLVLILLLAQSQSHPAEDYLTQGLKALDAHQPASAEPLLRKAVDADPADLNAQFNLALVLGMEGKDAEAIVVYRKTLELKPALYEADLNLGILLLRSKQPADAAVVLKEASEQKPAEFRPRQFYAQALYDTGDFEQAERCFREASGLDPKSAAANLGVARSLLRQGKLSDSADYFRAAASLDPTFKTALLELGSEYDKTGQNAEAIAIYKEFPSNDAATRRLTRGAGRIRQRHRRNSESGGRREARAHHGKSHGADGCLPPNQSESESPRTVTACGCCRPVELRSPHGLWPHLAR